MKTCSERVFVLANGPSLNEYNLDLLRDEVTISMNRFFLKKTDWDPTHCVIVDVKDMDGWPWEEILEKNTHYWIREYLKKCDGRDVFPKYEDKITWVKNCDCFSNPPYEWDENMCLYGGGVSVALQIASNTSCKDIYLLGADLYHRRVGEIDTNHFDPNYASVFYHERLTQLDWDRTNFRLIAAHMIARTSTTKRCQTIWSARPSDNEGILNVYPRVKYEDLFDR